MSLGPKPDPETLAFAAHTPRGAAGAVCNCMSRAVEAIEPGCTSWVERYVARLNAARAFLAARGMEPQRVEPDALIPQWRVPGWFGLFANDDLVALAASRGFDG